MDRKANAGMAGAVPCHDRLPSIITPDYIDLLQGLCAVSSPSKRDFAAVFDEFRRTLGGGGGAQPLTSGASCSRGDSSGRGEAQPSTSKASRGRGDSSGGGKAHPSKSKASSGRGDSSGGGKAQTSKSKASRSRGDSSGGGEAQPSASSVSSSRGDSSGAFERPCTKGTTSKDPPCWLLADLEAWNRILARNCVELREHCPGCLTLQGFAWPESNAPDIPDALRASLLVHVLLRQHRCVTRVIMDEAVTTLETDVFWHAVRTGCPGALYFEYNAYRVAPIGQPDTTPWVGASLWAYGVSSLNTLRSLHVAHARLEVDAALILTDFLAGDRKSVV